MDGSELSQEKWGKKMCSANFVGGGGGGGKTRGKTWRVIFMEYLYHTRLDTISNNR